MITGQAFRRLIPLAIVLMVSVAAGFAAIEVARELLEHNFKERLGTEVKRRAIEITAQTLNGNIMGAVAALGLVSPELKSVAQGTTPVTDPMVMGILEAVGRAYQANGAYVVNTKGIIQSCWYTVGVILTGVDVNFRPYFQIAMKGKQNVYAAIGTTTGIRSLYFAAPLYAGVSSNSPVIGATVARLGLERIDSTLKAWPAPALLLSPQDVTFASNRDDWVVRVAGQPTPEKLNAIRGLKQFGKIFEDGVPKLLPFDELADFVTIEDRRYTIGRAPVQWNDPNGDWTLVLLGDLDELMPDSRRIMIGTTGGALALALCVLVMVWRRRLRIANERRRQAEKELKAYTNQLEFDSAVKSYLGQLSNELHQASSLEEFSSTFMLHVVPRIRAEYGALYVVEECGKVLKPVGGHGVRPSELETFVIGQGLVGQCARTRQPIEISTPKESAIRIVWGGGILTPKLILLLPIVHTDTLLGVIVLAALRIFDGETRALLEAMLPMVAMNLEILERNVGIQRQAEALSQQQTQLRATESWYRGIIESAPDGMLVADENGVIILTNPHIDTLFGYEPGSLVGQNIDVLVPIPVRSHHAAWRGTYTNTGGANPMAVLGKELRGVRRDGSEFLVEVGLSRLPALNQRGVCVCASVRDVTARHVAEMEICQAKDNAEAARRQTEDMSDSLPLAIFQLVCYSNEQRQYTFVSKLVKGILGVSAEEMLSDVSARWRNVYSEDRFENRNTAREMVERAVRGEAEFAGPLEFRVVLNDKLRWAVSAAFPKIMPDGVVVWNGYYQDITERKQAEQALKDQSGFQQALIDTIPYPIFYKGADTRFLGVNRAYENAFEVRRQDLIGKRVCDLGALSEAERESYQAEDEKVIAEASSIRREVTLRYGDGRLRETLSYISGFRHTTGAAGGMVGTLIDVSDRKSIEELERFNRLACDREQRIITLKQEINKLNEMMGRDEPFQAAYDREFGEENCLNTEAGVNREQEIRGRFIEVLQGRQIEALFENFCDATNVAAAVVDLDGKVLVMARWKRVCADFHRVNTATSQYCDDCDAVLAEKIGQGREFVMHTCQNGLTECASPIIVNDVHVANAFIGQFFLNEPNLEMLAEQAKSYGFDHSEYIEAVKEVPVVDGIKLISIIGFLTDFAKVISTLSMANLEAKEAQERLCRERITAMSLAEDAEKASAELAKYQQHLEALVVERTRDLENAAAEVRQNEERLLRILNSSPLCFSLTSNGVIRFCNALFVDTFGVDAGAKTLGLYVNPDDYSALLERLRRHGSVQNYKVKMYNSRRQVRDMAVTSFPLSDRGEDGVLGWLADVTEGQAAEPTGMVNQAALVAVCRRLERLLAESDSEAEEVIEDNATVLTAAFSEQYHEIAALVRDFDYDAALTRVREVIGAIE